SFAPLKSGNLPRAMNGSASSSKPLTLPIDLALPTTENEETANPSFWMVPKGRPYRAPLRRNRLTLATWTAAAGSAIPVERRTFPSRESNPGARRVVFDIETSLSMTGPRRTETACDAAAARFYQESQSVPDPESGRMHTIPPIAKEDNPEGAPS